MNNLCIPRPFHVCVDDVGWFCGSDDRKKGGPSRTGINRFHTIEDYVAIENLGKAVNMKISCGFVLGEWDMENSLKALPHFSHFGNNWKNSEYRSQREMENIVDIINSAPHIDFTLHGLYHGYYKEGIDNHDSSDYFYRINKELFKTPESEIKSRLDAFFHIMEYHKIKKQVTQFIPPSFTYRQGDMAGILKSYGISYIATIFKSMEKLTGDVCDFVYSENGITVIDRNNNPIPWDEMAADFISLDDCNGILGIHWPNFLHENPERNDEAVKNAAEYINRCCSRFDTVAAEDISVCAMQQLVLKYGKITESDSGITVDLSSIPDTAHGNFFLVNSKKPLKSVLGGSFEEYKKYVKHSSYKIIPSENTVKISI